MRLITVSMYTTSAVTAPTCKAQGYTTYTCSICESTYRTEYTDIVDHNFVNGACTFCSATKKLFAESIGNGVFGIQWAQYHVDGAMYAEAWGGTAPNITTYIALPTTTQIFTHYGWIGTADDCVNNPGMFGYSIDGGTPVYSASFMQSGHNQGVFDAGFCGGATTAPVFYISANLQGLAPGVHYLEFYYKQANGNIIVLDQTKIALGETVVLGSFAGTSTGVQNAVGAREYGMRFDLGDNRLELLTINSMATFAQATNTWRFYIYEWNTDYATSRAGAPLYSLSGVNHPDSKDFQVAIPSDVWITGEVLVVLYQDDEGKAFTGWLAGESAPGYTCYLHGNPEFGNFAANVVVSPASVDKSDLAEFTGTGAGVQNGVGSTTFGMKFSTKGLALRQLTIPQVATFEEITTGCINQWTVRIWNWRTDYGTTTAQTPVYTVSGENHNNMSDFVLNIPADVIITGDILVEVAHIGGTTNAFTAWIGSNPVEGYQCYLSGMTEVGGNAVQPVAASVVLVPAGSVDEPDEPDTTPDVEPDGPSISINYPSAALPQYEQYTTVSRIEQVLANNTYAFALNGSYYYVNGVLYEGGNGIMTGANAMDASKLNALLGTGASGSTPSAVAASLGMNAVTYDGKVVLFYTGDAPLSTYEDLYTFEAMYLYMTAADETEIQNAFIDLPDRISNNASNTVFYTAPDLNLGVQTSVYFAQMGQANGLLVGPSLVAGEGKYSENFTTVRIFNNQQTVVTQFLAFDASVKGGVQVAAAQVNGETLIATAAFADHPGTNGDVRVFDAFGLLRMTINVHDIIDGPYTIATGHFAEGMKNEVLLIASQNTDANGRLSYVLVSLASGKVISRHTLDCSFAGNNTPVSITVRNNGSAGDTVILYFNSVQKVYEGNAQKAQFTNAGLTLPAEAVAVTASNVTGQKYTVALAAASGSENLSYLTVYNAQSSATKLDVGFRENRFFYASSTDGVVSGIGGSMNDDRYVSEAVFAHERTDDMNNGLIALLAAAKDQGDAAVDAVFDNAKYSDYASTVAANYASALRVGYYFLEPTFTHRWHKVNSGISTNYPNTILAMDALAGYGSNDYLTVDKTGTHKGYDEGNDAQFYTGTYADGILDLAKLRIYPLRSFLQTTAVGFRGIGSTPEHLVGVSPVHEQEITTAVSNSTNSAGDYNPKMIEGFRNYMLDAYGSADGINATFGTNFADDASITAPTDYTNTKFLQEWVLYNRYIVSKRIMEAYREALLAGYPPESISAHSIPDAAVSNTKLTTTTVSGNFRITPLDVILSCGTAYGGTRYGNTNTSSNLVVDAHNMGHSNITLGEFCSNQKYVILSQSQDKANTNAWNYLKSYWDNGLRFAHIICTSDSYKEAEIYAFKQLYTQNQPRPGYTGGTTGAVSVSNEGKQYTIVQIGNSSKTGLLKSIDSAGKWEGTVYLVPFHTKVNTTVIEMQKNANVYTTGALSYIKNSDQVELTFNAAKMGAGRAWVEIEVYNNGCLMEKSVTTYELTETMSAYRYVLSNQLYDSGLEVKVTFKTESGEPMDSIMVENMYATFQTEVASYTYFQGVQKYSSSQAHMGGVTFDLLDRNMVG